MLQSLCTAPLNVPVTYQWYITLSIPSSVLHMRQMIAILNDCQSLPLTFIGSHCLNLCFISSCSFTIHSTNCSPASTPLYTTGCCDVLDGNPTTLQVNPHGICLVVFIFRDRFHNLQLESTYFQSRDK